MCMVTWSNLLWFSVCTCVYVCVQLIAANLPPEIDRQLTNVCTVRFGTKELSSMFFELWFVVLGC